VPDRGLLERAAVAEARFDRTEPAVLTGARWLQLTFEVDRGAALASLPPDASRPIPPYARLLVCESPVQRFALLSVGARYRVMPRNVAIETVIDEDGPLAGLFGGSVTRGKLRIEQTASEITATLNGAQGPLATCHLPTPYAIEPSMLRWDGMLAVGRRDGVEVIAESAVSADADIAMLSKGARFEPSPSLERTHTWRRLRSLQMISACYAEGTLTFDAPVVQQAWS